MPGLGDGDGRRRGLLDGGVGTGSVSKAAAENHLPKETGCGRGFLQRADIPSGSFGQNGWWWAGSDQVLPHPCLLS